MTKEEIKRRISELREPKAQPALTIDRMHVEYTGPSKGGNWYGSWRWDNKPEPVTIELRPSKDWTGSEEASAVLRNELRGHILSTDRIIGIWFDDDFMQAVALAWLEMKGRS